ncbi:hypothetical protein [Novosphingobium sp. Chol11]|jgi:hypothetical protein|uniref:hypothetical protein n=1 Tax=Novosphingobium sp. Chol11 TaxID=1385763 RepID=UPI000BE26843|nr:hypothetical protein [Novosphingobium sp. Chol11]
MIRKLAFLAGAGFIAKKLFDRSRSDAQPTPGSSTARSRPSQASTEPSTGHVPADLLGDSHPDGTVRAEEHYRPDPTAPVSPEDRESLRPVTAPAPHDPPGR